MKTQKYAVSEALAYFEAYLVSGNVVHGSPFSDLDEFRLCKELKELGINS